MGELDLDELRRVAPTTLALLAEVVALREQVARVRAVALGHFGVEYLRGTPEHLLSSEGRLRLAILAALDAPKEPQQ